MAGKDETRLPASEADSDLLKEERKKGGGGEVGKPASEADEAAAAPREGDLDEGRPGRGGPGSFPPPD